MKENKTKRPSMRKCAYKHCPHPSFVPRRSDQIFCSKRCAHLASDERTGRKNHQKRKVVQPELTPVEEAYGLLHGQMAELKIERGTAGLRETAALSLAFHWNRDYFERRITALNRRACLHEGEHCGIRARQEITGMLCVLNALGYEAVGDWTRYDGEFELVRAADLAAKKEGGIEPLRFKEYDADSRGSSQLQCRSRRGGCDSKRKSAPREPLPVLLLKRLKGRIADWDALADRFYKAREEDRMRILCEALGIKLRSATKEASKCQ